ncbi:MAG TPA: metalloprotease TldD [Sphingomicrobium sp.]|nr:metalloprotease TldD [Sphingomicrobium sp.]
MTPDPRQVLYRSLDPGEARRLAARHLSGCDDGELFLEHCVSEAFGFDDGLLKTASYDSGSGFGLRGVTGETTAFAHANEISAEAIGRAAETLTLLGSAQAAPAASPARTNQAMYGAGNPLIEVPFANKVALCQQIDTAARSRDPRVVQVGVSLSASWRVIEIIRADGFVATDIRPLVRLGVQIVAAENDRRETGFFGIGGRYAYERIFDPGAWNRCVDEALGQALTNLRSVAAPAGEMPVVLGSGWCGVLLHEAVGHGLEGDFNRKGTSAFSGRIGERVAAPGVTVVDDGAMPELRGSLTIDDEGTPTRRNVLIEDGILKGYLQDRLNARLMGMEPTGSGRRESFAHAPMPRMNNTFMLAGNDNPGELVERVKDGIYAKSFGGGQVDITSGKFVFSCTEAYRIRNGRIAEPVKGATLIGDGPTVLTKIKGIGNDLALDEGIGVCGKGGQSVPAGVGQPSLLIDGVTVGGTAA